MEYVEYDKWVYIIMECVPGGELSTFIGKSGPMPEHLAQMTLRQMLHALNYLHLRGITHRDIKPDNILIASADPFVLKLSDFGLSKVVKDNETFLRTFCGTLLYCAPEVYPGYQQYVTEQPRKRRRAGDP